MAQEVKVTSGIMAFKKGRNKMTEKNTTASGSDGFQPLSEQGGALAGVGARRRYSAPRLLSSEFLELAASICDGSGGAGSNYPFPPCVNSWGT